jgi:adenylate cyclase, class 2
MANTQQAATISQEASPFSVAFLPVALEPLRAILAELPATQRVPRALVIRKVFSGSTLGQHQTLRLLLEPSRALLTLNRPDDAGLAQEPCAIETEVSDAAAAAELLGQLGLRQQHCRECYHEEWSIGDLTFQIETWPDLPTLLTIGGPDEAAVTRAAKRLQLPCGSARRGTIEDIYLAETGRDIRSEATLLFPREMIR